MPRYQSLLAVAAIGLSAACASPRLASAQFDLQFTITSQSVYTATQLAILQEAADEAERVLESLILGYQPGINLTTLPIDIRPVTTGLGAANGIDRLTAGGFTVFTNGFMNINRLALEDFSDFNGTGTNVIDELIIHEVGHVLGIGTLWVENGVYINNSGEYTGEFGVRAYRREFDPAATFVPVELSGPIGSRNAHWDQFFRSAEGPPGVDPFTLSPLTGITDAQGRDLGLEIMTAALDPDFGEPFISMTTVQSLRDLGFVVVPEPGSGGLAIVGLLTAARRRCRPRRLG